MPDTADELCRTTSTGDGERRVYVPRTVGVNWLRNEYYKIPAAERRASALITRIMRAGLARNTDIALRHLAFIGPLNMEVSERSFLVAARGTVNGVNGMTPRAFKDRARMAFDYADMDAAGSLSKREYKIAMTAVFGCRPDKVEVQRVFQCRERRISFEEFERCVNEKSVENDFNVNAEILFSLLDKNYKGFLVLDDFYSASRLTDLRVPWSVWQTVFKGLDPYRRGYIEFHEFLRIFSAA